MKTNHSYALTASLRRGGLFHSRLFVASLILALIAAFLPARRSIYRQGPRRSSLASRASHAGTLPGPEPTGQPVPRV